MPNDGDSRLMRIEHRDGDIVEEGWAYSLNDDGAIRHITSIAGVVI